MTTPWRKLDLHVHTPGSTCYRDMTATPVQIVDAAVSAGLDAISVTDHNAVSGLEATREAASRRGLTVFPGVELSTKEGHVLALFDPKTALAFLDEFLDEVGIDRDSRGDAKAMTNCCMEDTFGRIAQRGGLAIAAHIERWPSGFLESREPRAVKAAIHASENLSALEITVPQNKLDWNEGRVWGYPRKLACIQTSDAHSPAEIGRRPVHIEMEHLDLTSLRLAFVEYNTRIVFPEELAARLHD
jgi:predicted metal-dependent phosphoesterase TrpH